MSRGGVYYMVVTRTIADGRTDERWLLGRP
jgi:hypothetical protein